MDKFTMNSNAMKGDEYDQISRMLGHSDSVHLFDDERCYEPTLENNWPKITNNSVLEMPPSDIQPTKRLFTKEQRFSDQETNKDTFTPPTLLTKSNCNSEICLDRCSRNSNMNNTLNGTFPSNPITKQILYRRLCLCSIIVAFILGVLLGILIPFVYITKDISTIDSNYSLSKYQSLIVINKPVNSTLTPVDKNYQQLNPSVARRVFHPLESKFDYIKSKMEFPTIHDSKYKNKINKIKYKQSNPVKLNKPKIFHSVSFVEDENVDAIQKINSRDGSTTKDTLLKYLDLTASNGSNNFFDDFGKKILESSLDEESPKTLNANNEKENVTILHNNVFWGKKIEESLPSGFGLENNSNWMKYVKSSSAVKMESGCGRMQNRLVTFLDGTQACVRYRQNTDQIQGELFSFYLAQVLKLPNLAPSLVSIVNLTDPLWHNVASDIGSAQWNSNRPVVMTKYIPNLEAAHIPGVFKPSERHLNKFDIFNIVKKGSEKPDDAKKNNLLLKKITEGLFSDRDFQTDLLRNSIENKNGVVEAIENSLKEEVKEDTERLKANIGDALLDKFIELAQWSDLIIFDYLTANLDRIVNNLYNFQWNANIMDAPAHNLARKVDSNLLLFLDNESGLLHGYRLLHKYEVYHSLLLDSLCMFRKSTAEIIKELHSNGNVGDLLNKMFKDTNDATVLDILPPLPDKSVKILNERIARVAGKIRACEEQFGR